MKKTLKALSNAVTDNVKNLATSTEANSLEQIRNERQRILAGASNLGISGADNIGRILGSFDEFGVAQNEFSKRLSTARFITGQGDDITARGAKSVFSLGDVAKELEELETFRRTGRLPEEFANLPTITENGKKLDAADQFLKARAFASDSAAVPNELRRVFAAQKRVVQTLDPTLKGVEVVAAVLERLSLLETIDPDILIEYFKNFGVAIADADGSAVEIKSLGDVAAETQRKLEDASLKIQNAFSKSARIFADGIDDINASFIGASKVLESFTSGFSFAAGSISGSRSLSVAQNLGIATPNAIGEQLTLAEGIARGFNAVKESVGDAAIQAFRGPQSERPKLSGIEQRSTDQLTIRDQVLQALAIPKGRLDDTANAFMMP